jgi:hypothetical protein
MTWLRTILWRLMAGPSATTRLEALKQYGFPVHPRWQR